MQVGIVFIPGVSQIFSLTALAPKQWAVTFLASIAPIIIMEFQKKLNEIVFGKPVYTYKEIRN